MLLKERYIIQRMLFEYHIATNNNNGLLMKGLGLCFNLTFNFSRTNIFYFFEVLEA